MRLFSLSLILLLVILGGCSQLSNKKKVKEQASTESQTTSREENLKIASDNLAELVKNAKAAGPDQVNYFSGDMYLKASYAQINGDYHTANLIFKHLVDLVPEDYFIKKKYAVSLIRTGEIEASRPILEDIFVHSKKQDEKIGLILAGVYTTIGDSKNAIETYNHLLSINPKNEDACVFLSKSYAIDDQYDSAIKALDGCEKNNKGKGIFSYYIGKLYLEKGDKASAEKYFKKTIAVDKTFSQAVVALGLLYEDREKYNQAIDLYKGHLVKFPQDSYVLSRIVQVMFSQEQFAEVIPYAERLSDFEQEDLNLKVKLGILYSDAKDYNKAINVFKDILRYVPASDKIQYYLGAIYQEVKDFENAITHFSSVPTSSGLYQDSVIQIATMMSSLALQEFEQKQSGKYSKSFVKYVDDKMNELPTMQVEFAVIKAGYFETVSSYGKAVKALEPIKNHDGFSENHQYYLASLYEKEERYADATKMMKAILARDPENAHAWNFLGYSLVERGEDMDQAYEYLQKAVKISPNDGYIRDSLGWYYFKKGNYNKALKELETASKLVRNDLSIQKHLAIIYTKLKNFQSAKTHVVEALKLVKHDHERAELYEVLKNLEANRIPASFEPFFEK
jgi:tetratricopeptide (TPR) repeat protein